jgi:hypothetical protein
MKARTPRPALRRAAPLAVLALVVAARPASSGGGRPETAVAQLHGILSGCILRPEPYFRWQPNEKARAGVLGTVVGTTREFEEITLELGADRRVLTAPLRAAYEAARIKRDVERGVSQAAEVKADGAVVRIRGFANETVYASATKQIGRTVLFVRGQAEKKDEAGLVRLVRAFTGTVTCTVDDVDGWLPKEIKATWARQASADLIVVDDGVDPAVRDAAVKAVRDAHAVVKRVVPGSYVTVPVVRITKSRDMFGFLSGRKELRALDAAYEPAVAELIVSPRSPMLDVAQVAGEAAAQALHHLLGGADAEPVLSGVRRVVAATASGAPGGLAEADEARAIERAKTRAGKSWRGLLMLSTLSDFLGEDAEERALDAQLAVAYLLSPSASAGKASLSAWTAAFRKAPHPDAASEAGIAAMDATKADAEYWSYWSSRADGGKKPKGK